MGWWTEYASRNSSICGQNFLLEIAVFRDGGSKFEDLYRRFPDLGTRMTQPNKFRYVNGHFASSGTGMTHRNKFRDR